MGSNVKASDLEQELVAALNEKEAEALQLLAIANGEEPKQVAETIREYVDKLLAENRKADELKELALQLGALWGSMVVKEYGWTWKYLDFGDDVAGIYIVSPSEYYCCPPLYFMNKILQANNIGLDGKNDNTVLLLFNMIEGIENQKPQNKYQIIS